MKYLDQYSISYAGLSLGHHVFNFEAGAAFFACFESSEISDAGLSVMVDLEKSAVMLELQFHLLGKVKVICDRCGDEFFLPVDTKDRLIVKFGEESFENTEEILVLPHAESELNIAQYIYEYLIVSLPARRVHPEGECNEEALRKLEEYQSKKEDDDIDPRWEMLKNIKLN